MWPIIKICDEPKKVNKKIISESLTNEWLNILEHGNKNIFKEDEQPFFNWYHTNHFKFKVEKCCRVAKIIGGELSKKYISLCSNVAVIEKQNMLISKLRNPHFSNQYISKRSR